MSRPYTWDLDPSGADEGDIPILDGGIFVPGPPPGGPPTGPAGGVLSGTYPDPGFAPGAIPDVASDLGTAYLPLTTTVGGVPELVWDADNSLIPTEVPL